jgi:hypothetical protein
MCTAISRRMTDHSLMTRRCISSGRKRQRKTLLEEKARCTYNVILRRVHVNILQWKHNNAFYVCFCRVTCQCQLNRYIQLCTTTSYSQFILLTPCSTVLLKKLTGFQLIKKFPAFYGTRRFITAFTSAHQLSLSSARSIQSKPPHPNSRVHRNIILQSTPGSPKWSLSIRFPHQNPLYASPLPYTRYMLRPSHSSRFDHPDNIG